MNESRHAAPAPDSRWRGGQDVNCPNRFSNLVDDWGAGGRKERRAQKARLSSARFHPQLTNMCCDCASRLAFFSRVAATHSDTHGCHPSYSRRYVVALYCCSVLLQRVVAMNTLSSELQKSWQKIPHSLVWCLVDIHAPRRLIGCLILVHRSSRAPWGWVQMRDGEKLGGLSWRVYWVYRGFLYTTRGFIHGLSGVYLYWTRGFMRKVNG